MSQRPTPGSRSPIATRAAASDSSAIANITPRQVSAAQPLSAATTNGASTLPPVVAAWYADSTRIRPAGGYESIRSGWCRTRTLPVARPSTINTIAKPHGPTTNAVSAATPVHTNAVTMQIVARRARCWTSAAIGSVATATASSFADSSAASVAAEMPRLRAISGPSTTTANPYNSVASTSALIATSGYQPGPDRTTSPSGGASDSPVTPSTSGRGAGRRFG